MFEMMLLSGSIYLINSIFSGIYTESFLKGRYQKKITLTVWIVICFLCQIVIFEIVGSKYQINDIVQVVVNLCILFFLQLLLFRKDLMKQAFVIFSFIAGKEIVKYIVSIFNFALCELWNRTFSFLILEEKINTVKAASVFGKISTGVISIISALLYAILLIVYLRLIRREFVKKDYQLQVQESVFLILPSIAALCISITIKMMIVTVENGRTVIIYETVPATQVWIPVICFLLLSTIVANVMLFQKFVQYNEETRKRIMLENQVQQMQKEVTEIQDIYADMRGLRHDMRSHLSNISLYVKTIIGTDSEELKSYIGKMEETVSRLDFIYQTGNPITDIIIHQKSQEAQKKKIQFDVDFIFPSKQKIDAYDVGVVLDNALENAIEACCEVEGEKSIYLHAFVKGNLFFIEIENSYSGKVVFDVETGLPVSHKKDAKLHGLGISNIQRCAKKYMGDIDIVLSDTGNKKRFNLTIMMYGKISHP